MINSPSNRFRSLLFHTIIISALSLSACGGGSDDHAGNNAPVAKAGADQSVNVDTAVSLDGSDSSDMDGDTLSYSWSLTSMPSGSNSTLVNANSVKSAFTPDIAGTYIATITVSDGSETATDQVKITVVAANTSENNTAPIANAGTAQSINVGDSVSLDASGSNDPDGDSLTYNWAFTSRPTGSSATLSSTSAVKPTFTADVAGSYVLKLTVNDGQKNATDSVMVTANAATAVNTAPVANAGVDKNVDTGTLVTLDASGSSDVDGDTLSYTWATVSLPSGSSAVLSSVSVVKPTFTADIAGSYTFQVSVSDGNEVAVDQVNITVTTPTLAGTDSTAGVLCDFNQSINNTSASVNAVSTAAWTCTDTSRNLTANGMPDHAVGIFPNSSNPNAISVQSVSVSYALTPVETGTATALAGSSGPVGYVLNGVKIDANTAGSCDDSGASCSLIDQSGNWSIEALGHNSFDFGTDDNNAHVQPGGAYHYHGMPEGFIALRGGNSSKMTLIGWAADGFPIYARYGYSDANNASSALKNLTGSYQLVSNVSSSRPPVSTYALGTFAQDWEYVAGSGDLDECNGRFGVTPEFPDGIYHYYATDSYPYFQRCVTGEVEVTGGGAGGPPPR